MIVNPSAVSAIPKALDLSSGSRTPTLAEAAGEFEAYLVGELLRSATHSAAGPGPFDGGEAGRMYRELFYAELGRSAARAGVFGLAQSVQASGQSAAEIEEVTP